MPVSSSWEVLGLTPGASQDAIRQAYRKLAQRHHPDKHPNDPEAQARFQAIQAAYTELSRNGGASSRSRSGGAASSVEPEWGDLDEIFRQVFRASHATAVRRVELALTLEQVSAGGVQTLTLPGGQSGRVLWQAGVDHGDRLPILDAQGVLPGWEAVVRVRPHAHYVRQGADLEGVLVLSYAQIVRGGALKLSVLGQSIEGRLPPRLTPGQRLRLAGHGLPHPAGGRGDLYLVIQLELPEKWTAAQLKALESLDNKLHPSPKPPASRRPAASKVDSS